VTSPPDDWTPEEAPARALGRLLADRATPSDGLPAWQRLGERNLLQAARGRASESARWPRVALGRAVVLGAGLAFVVAAGASVWRVTTTPELPERLTFAVRGAPQGDGTTSGLRLEGSAGQPTSLDFSDGSIFTVHADSVARLAASDAHGAVFVLERGGLDARVTPRQNARWSVRAGDYEVRIVGTAFTTLWDPQRKDFAVLLREGAVRILGPEVRGEVELRAGQRFGATSGGGWSITPLEELHGQEPPLADKDALVRETGAADARVTSPDTKTPSARLAAPGSPLEARTDGSTRASSGAAPSPSREVPASQWTTLVNEGRFDQVLSEAEQRGLDSCFAACASLELRALADAARYSGRVTLARDALLALRQRAPDEASRAAYFLGSLSESRGQAAGALEWYTRSLEEDRESPLAAEARAGRMRTLLALGRRAEARVQADEYLRLHPSGVAAERARQVSRAGR
jgi:hypothetical protein